MPEVPVPDQIAAVARISPDAIAVSDATSDLSYADLVRLADRVACHLLRGGAEPGDVVAVCLDRDAALVVAMLGILRAGCCYLPLDPGHPAARLGFMLADAGARAVITPSDLVAGDVPRIDVHAAMRDPSPCGQAFPAISADDLAYIIYTSGSTGQPKGVAVTHRNVARLFGAVHERIAFDAADTWSWFHSPAFDFSVWEIWGALTSGGRVVVVSLAQAHDPAELLELLKVSKTTMLSQTPSAFQRLLPLLHRDGPSWSVRTVILGGESVSVDAFEQILGGPEAGWPRVYNLYGITEATVHATVKELTRQDLRTGVRSPIGRPLADMRFAVLDPSWRPVPAGEPGELWIAGAGVARGYVGKPELTAERFVTGLLPEYGDTRWYRSGDLVSQLGSGDFEYIGRIDRQVKLRGFRIELGEIEAALTSHRSVTAAAVELRDAAGPAGRQLAAYLVPASAPPPAEDELREWLGSRLPDHMIPSTFTALGELPLTVNGKVDRDILLATTGSQLPRRGGQLPLTPAEAALQPIWADILGVPDVGPQDSFFGAGGDSMLALQLVTACRAAGIAITVKDVFAHPRLCDLAAAAPTLVDRQERAEPPPQAPAGRLMPAGIEALIPASQMQCGVLFESELHQDAGTYHVVSGSAISGLRDVDSNRVRSVLEELAARNVALRTNFDLANFDAPMQLVHERVAEQLSYVDLSMLPESSQRAQTAKVFAAEERSGFHHSDYPLWRVSCLKTSPTSVYAILTHHHAVLDGWSVAKFFDQFQAALTGRPYQTAPISVHESAARLEAMALESAADDRYWRAVTKSWTPLPTSGQPPAAATAAPLINQAAIDPPFRARIAATAAGWQCSPKHIHMAAHLRSLARFAQWSDYAATGLVVNARPEEPAAPDALGMFLNVVPFVLDGLGQGWQDLAHKVMREEMRLQQYRWFPLATMIRRFAMPPLNVWLNYTDFSGTAMRNYLQSVTEFSPTGMPITVSIVDDGVLLRASPQTFSASQAADLLDSHMSNLRAAVA